MNVKRFTARTSRDALALVRQALGDDAVVLSTKPVAPTASRCWRWRRKACARLEAAVAPRRRRRRRRGRRRRSAAAQRVEPALPPSAGRRGRRAPVDEHAVVPGLRARAHAASRRQAALQSETARASARAEPAALEPMTLGRGTACARASTPKTRPSSAPACSSRAWASRTARRRHARTPRRSAMRRRCSRPALAAGTTPRRSMLRRP